MSQLDQAKREAIRLLKIAKKNSINDLQPFQLEIKNLSHSREHIANINGYQNWNAYEKELNKRDLIQGNIPKNEKNEDIKFLLENTHFFNRIIPFIFNENHKKDDYKIVEDKKHTPIKAGEFLSNSFYSMKESFINKSKEWKITSYPVMLSGSTGSGKTESLLSFGRQYIENNEGFIYIDGKGYAGAYTLLHRIVNDTNKLDNFYVLNFINKAHENEMTSHTIDPINPLIGDEEAFKLLWGDQIGILIHELSKCVKEKNGLVSIENIESFMMLNTLNELSNDSLFIKAKIYIDDYLNTLKAESIENQLKLHALNCGKFFDVLEMFNQYKHIFSINPQIDLEKVYYKRKILLVMFPSLEKNPSICQTLFKSFILSLNKTIKNFENLPNVQNIVIDNAGIGISDKLADYVFSTPFKSANMIYGLEDYRRNFNYTNYIIKHSKTFILSKMEGSDLPDALKMKIMDNLENFPSFYKNHYLKSQGPGAAYIFGFNSLYLDKKTTLNYHNGYSFSSIKLVYAMNQKKITKHYYLNRTAM